MLSGGIRWTPDRIDGNPYYNWIAHGLELYALLPDAIECFSTASWTRWAGPRRGRRAARRAREALARQLATPSGR